MSYQPVEFRVRCTCGTILEAEWEVPNSAVVGWDEEAATKYLIVKPCPTCQRKLLPLAPPWACDFKG